MNWHAFERPLRQEAHLPQFVYGESATSVPAGSELSPSMTVADTSCPRIRGNVTSGFRPRNELRSLPQNPTIRTFSNNSPGETTGLGTVSTDASPGFLSTSAFTREVTSGRICNSTHTRVGCPLCSGLSRKCVIDSPNVYYSFHKLKSERQIRNCPTAPNFGENSKWPKKLLSDLPDQFSTGSCGDLGFVEHVV